MVVVSLVGVVVVGTVLAVVAGTVVAGTVVAGTVVAGTVVAGLVTMVGDWAEARQARAARMATTATAECIGEPRTTSKFIASKSVRDSASFSKRQCNEQSRKKKACGEFNNNVESNQSKDRSS